MAIGGKKEARFQSASLYRPRTFATAANICTRVFYTERLLSHIRSSMPMATELLDARYN